MSNKKRLDAVLADKEWLKEMGFDPSNPSDIAEIMDIVDSWENTDDDPKDEDIKNAKILTDEQNT